MSLTILQKTNGAGFPKAGELIEITGAHELETSDRAILDILYQHAHDSGRLADPTAEWEIPLMRLFPPARRYDRVRDSLKRLMRVVVTVPVPDPATGEPDFLLTHLFDFFQVPGDEGRPGAMVRFGIPRKLQPLLMRSSRWGRIKAEIVIAMTSKYAIALYEIVQLRANMERCVEVFPIDRFRALLGVPPGKLTRGPDFTRFVIQPALLEVNGLSDMSIDITINRRSPRAPIESVTVAWWRKEGEEFRAALRERDRSKVGRMARLRCKTETVIAKDARQSTVSPIRSIMNSEQN